MENETAKKIGFAALMLVVLAIGALFYFGPKPVDNDARINVFAASSFAWVLHENRDLIEAQTGLQIVVVEAASSTLARQITEGAPADIFITADNMWLEYLVGEGVPESEPTEIARNRLVFARHINEEDYWEVCYAAVENVTPECPNPLFFITGDPDYVPLGKYAKEVLSDYGGWETLKRGLITTQSARAAVQLLEAKAANWAILYKTDALASPNIKIAHEYEETLHTPIIYWAVPLKDSNEDATENFINFLKSQAFRTILEDKGFAIN